MFSFFLLPTELIMKWKITDDQNSNGQIPLVIFLPTVLVSHTDGPNLSVKLFNGVVQ